MCCLIFSLFFFLCFGVLRLTTLICLLEGKNLEKVIFLKSHSNDTFFFFFWNKADFLSSDHRDYGQVVFGSGMWTKQKRTLERESSEFMAGSTCSVCQYLWCHKQIKTIPSAIYINMVPRLQEFMPMFPSKFKAIQMFGMQRAEHIFTHLFYFSRRESELSLLSFIFEVSQNKKEWHLRRAWLNAVLRCILC